MSYFKEDLLNQEILLPSRNRRDIYAYQSASFKRVSEILRLK
jgi:hypothetical protein